MASALSLAPKPHGDEHPMDFGHGAGERQWCLGFQRKGLHRIQIFQHVVEAARWREITRGKLRHELLHDAAVGAAPCQRCRNFRRINAAGFRQFHGFGHRLKGQGAEQAG